jgi:hypothetical protein
MLSRNLPTRWLTSGDWTGKITAQEGMTEQLLAAMGVQLTLHETRRRNEIRRRTTPAAEKKRTGQ